MRARGRAAAAPARAGAAACGRFVHVNFTPPAFGRPRPGCCYRQDAAAVVEYGPAPVNAPPHMPSALARSARRHHALRLALALGPLRSVLMLTLAAGVLAIGLAAALGLLLGVMPLWPLLAVALVSAAVVTPLVAWPLLRMLADLEAKRAQLDVLATRDELTGVHNRRQFLVLADREWSRCRRYDTGAAVLMIDVDHFKAINDHHGHLAGDLMLREIARVAGETLRRPDLFGRYGGEEFMVFLPHADALGALDAAERIRACVAALALEWKEQVVRTTVSIGVATLDNTHDSFATLIQDADQALYAAKDAGRNCVRTMPLPPARRHGASTSITSPR